MASADKKLAYEAGQAAYASEPGHRRHPDSCPFPPGDERAEWMRGFAEALDEEPDRGDLRRALNKEGSA